MAEEELVKVIEVKRPRNRKAKALDGGPTWALTMPWMIVGFSKRKTGVQEKHDFGHKPA